MIRLFARLDSRAVEIKCPASLAENVATLFGARLSSRAVPIGRVHVDFDRPDRFSIESRHGEPVGNLSRSELLLHLLDAVTRELIFELADEVALHAASVLAGSRIVLIAGPTGAGKSTVAAWLADHGMPYLGDELATVSEDGVVRPFARALAVKPATRDLVAGMSFARDWRRLCDDEMGLVLAGLQTARPSAARRCRLILLPRHESGSGLAIEPLSPAETLLRLMECNLNARNLHDHGLALLRQFAAAVPALRVRYGEVGELAGVVEHIPHLVEGAQLAPPELHRLLSGFRPRAREALHVAAPAPAPVQQPLLPATPRRGPVKLTIGMATFDDYDGVYFTIQAIRLYHAERLAHVEFLVVDNRPEGPSAKPLKNLETWIPNYRYVPRNGPSGTATRNAVFEEASGTYVLCVDCHVLIFKDGLARLLDYFDQFPETSDLLHGPLVYDDLSSLSTHMQPRWRAGMFGTWERDSRAIDADASPFEIPMQGLGLFACRRDAWLGFNPDFRGFGGEEGYIHEKFRQAGRRVLCLPFLRWVHRFARPLGVPYRLKWEDRIRNYLIGFAEIGAPTNELEHHFKELLGESVAERIFTDIREEVARPG